MTPTVLAAETRFWDFIGDAEPESLAGVAVKLRWARTQESDPKSGSGLCWGNASTCLRARSPRGASSDERPSLTGSWPRCRGAG